MTPFHHASPIFRRLNAGLFADTVAPVVARLPHTEPEHPLSPALVSDHESQGRSKTGPAPRPAVRFTLYRCRLLDSDNAVASVKFILDALVAERLLDGDGPDDIELAVDQVRVRHREQEGTMIVIDRPNHESP